MTTDYIDADGYRANVGIVLMNDDRQVFIGGRVGARGWQFPQGGIRRGERPEQALYRELAEEVGLRPGQVIEVARTKRWLRYRLQDLKDDPAAVKAYGIEVVTRLCERLIEQGAPGLHFYTMNQAEPTTTLVQALGLR